MPTCYWTKCSCPDQQPCNEHAGWNCGRWGNVLVTDLATINDAVTHDAEVALVALDQDRARVDAIEQDLLQKRDELERERREIDQMFRAAGSRGERRLVADRVQAAYDRLPQLNQQLQQVLTDLNTLASRVTAVGGVISTYLIVPYSSPTGYCTCYDEKRNRLAAIDGQRGRLMSELRPLLAQRATYVNQLTPLFGLVANTSNPIRVMSTVAFIAALATWVLVGWFSAAIVALIGAFVLILMLIGILLIIAGVDKQIMRVRSRIVTLDLQYYRLQQITTCQQPPPVGPPLPPGTTPPGTPPGTTPPGTTPPGTAPPVTDENAWWIETTGPELPSTPPPDDD
jgi:hypothetical protein